MRLRTRSSRVDPVGGAVPLRDAGPGAPPVEASGSPALLVTGEARLREEVGRLAAAAALRLEVVDAVDATLTRWAGAAVVLVGPDLVAGVAELRPPSRPEVYVLADGVGDGLYRHALALGAQSVVELPRAEAWLADLLADLAEGRVRHARTVAVVPGSGGAGASVLAAALAQVAARDRTATVVDLDAGGGGADRLLGVDDLEGLRWDRLADVHGRLSARALREALPGDDALRVLTFDPTGTSALPDAAVVREVVRAAQRGSDVVVLDVPRDLDRAGVADAVRLADLVVVCSQAALLPVVASGRLCARIRGLGLPVGLVVRTGPGSVDPLDVADTLGLPLLAQVRTRRRTEELIELGLGPAAPARAPLVRPAREVLAALAALPEGAAA